ncbi:helicase-related protein [Sneathiella litorea]|uniref:Disulfide oxidoreductase n=1 Tax=Sneathiella litorea TaxID=2606216 RepID=A0A6L8W2L2_9PROT|nr:helicase-related protein [Sneathiella litorea]MZR29295.1 disulfide oxidoreductase [Sneathiella litorea]
MRPISPNNFKTGQVTAILGPTNTGKTHLAVERMMGHADGVIGLPLRLLAREVYERVVAIKGAANVALVTGEEKIIPPQAAYFVCTVEAMPLDRGFEFLAVDEIQLAEDPERGHIFTDRLLYARGREETLFLGAETIRPWIKRLIPEATYISRPRFSKLVYRGAKKISRLRPRTAIVAFSSSDVYAIAELVRRQRGGAAVVMGSLSPRTRNAQVELYQSGDVDYLVATDAIGMGLNMDIDHVAFAGTVKYDGSMSRRLRPAEFAQIAGRAGRHMNNGSFGTTANVEPLEDELIEKIEGHNFEAVRQIRWRNLNLDFTTTRDLLRSLETLPAIDGMVSPRDPDDYNAFRTLIKDEKVRRYSQSMPGVRQLWQVCQVPDFRKTMHDVHVRLIREIFLHLQGPTGKLPADWIAGHLKSLEKIDGDIDTLATRIAHTRTWTYISHVSDWVDDYKYWQETARTIEDKLSDALHERLTQRFVDRRTAMLVRKLKDRSQLEAQINETGEVHVEGHFLGTLTGLKFNADTSLNNTEARTLRNIGNKAVAAEIAARAARLASAEDAEITLDAQGKLIWQETPIATLAKGDMVLKPRIQLLASEQLNGSAQDAATKRLSDWVSAQIEARLKPLVQLETLPLTGAARGIAFQVSENLGAMPRYKLGDQIRLLEKKDYGRLKFGGIRVGYEHVFMPILLKPDPTALRCLLWAIFQERAEIPPAPPAGRVSFETDGKLPWTYYLTAGYAVYDKLAVRLDMLDRLAGLLRRASRGLLEDPEAVKEKAKDPIETTPSMPDADAAKQETEKSDTVTPEESKTITETEKASPSPEPEKSVEAEQTPPETSQNTAEQPDGVVAEASIDETLPATQSEEEKPAGTGEEKRKKDLPRNLPFKPTHEMLSLVGTTREQFSLILDKLGYIAEGEGEDLTYRRKSFKKKKQGPKPERRDKTRARAKDTQKSGNKRPAQAQKRPQPKQKEIDPDSPFAILKTLGKK